MSGGRVVNNKVTATNYNTPNVGTNGTREKQRNLILLLCTGKEIGVWTPYNSILATNPLYNPDPDK